MTQWDEGVEYKEIAQAIEDYSKGGDFHQFKALELIAEHYTPFGNLPMEKMPKIVEAILKNHNYLFWYGGRPSLGGLSAVIACANWGQDKADWGHDLLNKVGDALWHEYTEKGSDKDSFAEYGEWVGKVNESHREIFAIGDAEISSAEAFDFAKASSVK